MLAAISVLLGIETETMPVTYLNDTLTDITCILISEKLGAK